MTKLKNTKKGMAKKALSISLVAAMLATSNVPVWAAEFTDGTDAVVEAPVVEEAVDTFSAEAEAPVVEEEVTAAVTSSNLPEINVNDYTISDLKIGTVGEWGTAVAVSGSIKDGGNDVTGLEYTWMADGVQASGAGAVGTATGNIAATTYTPVKEDYAKTLSLVITKKGANGSVIFRHTITAENAVKAQDLSALNTYKTVPSLVGVGGTTITYNGEEQKPAVGNLDAYKTGVEVTPGSNKWLEIGGELLDWHYETEGNDFTNVTDKDITVYGTLTGTDDPSSPSYGYTATTVKTTYKISKLTVNNDNFKPSLKTTSVEYTGAVQKFGKKDLVLEVKVSDTKKVDITAALKDDYIVSGTDKNVGTNYTVKGIDLRNAVATTKEAKEILKNFDVTDTSAVVTTNTYEITKRDLSTCTAVSTKDFLLKDFRGLSSYTLTEDDKNAIVLTGRDGKTFTLKDIENDVVVQVNQAVFDAANKNQTGSVANAITISYKADATTANVTGSVSLPINLVVETLGNVYVHKGNSSAWTQMSNTKTAAESNTDTTVQYIGKAYTLTGKSSSDALNTLTVNNVGNTENLDPAVYDVEYSDNINAGIVEVTITGNSKGNYNGCVKRVYFKIAQDEVNKSEFTVKQSVTVNPANNQDPALYKEALGAEIKTTLANNTKATLVEGKDYTVEYYYADANSYSTLDDIKAHPGTNTPGQYVYAVATLAEKGNYKLSGDALVACARIANKSIANVTVTVEKDAYTYTGKEITPNVTVKDGTVVLEKGVDYTLKFKNNIQTGTATVTVVPTADSDYDVNTFATATFEITPAKAEDVKVVLGTSKSAISAGKENTFKYTGKQIKPVIESITLNGKDVKDQFDVAYLSYGENVNAGKEGGSVVVAPKAANKNFTGTKTQLFDIKGKELNGTLKAYYSNKKQVSVSAKTAYVTENGSNRIYSEYYDGAAHTFDTAKFSPAALTNVKEGTDYEIKYIDNVDAGAAFVAVVAKGNYEGSLTHDTFWFSTAQNEPLYGYSVKDGQLLKGTKVIEKNIVDIIAFNIKPSIFTARNITVSNGAYAGGIPVKPDVKVVVNGKTLAEGKDYKLDLTSIDGESTPDKFVNVTEGKPYYVTVVPMGGYAFDDANGTNTYVWGIDKKDLNDCFVGVVKDGEDLSFTVMNGNVKETVEKFELTDNGNGTATVSVVDGGVNYTGSKTVSIEKEDTFVEAPVIKEVNVVGNKATVVLEGECEGATGYDFVISTNGQSSDKNRRVNKNVLATDTTFQYLQQGIYWAHCHAWKKVNGKKVFSAYSEAYPFSVTAITPDQPSVTSVKVSKNTVKVTYTKSANATGYDLVLGKSMKKVNGEMRPVEYGKLVKKVYNGNTVTATFTKVPKGTYYVGLHAYNRTSEDGKKVFSPWSNAKKVVVK